MAKYELSIKGSYVPDWGLWESVREIMQNGLDEDDRGHALRVIYEKGVLSVHNEGADLSAQFLILGMGDKAGKEGMRGKHGEGLALGLLAGVRGRAAIKIRTQREIWTASIGKSALWNTDVLIVRTRKSSPYSGVTVYLPLEAEVWDNYKKRFLRFTESESIETCAGKLLLSRELRGMLYDKGIFVEKKKDISYGYDYKNASLDRDRRFISDFDFKWESSRILEEAAAANPGFLSDFVDVISKDGDESRAVALRPPSESLKNKVAEFFVATHGKYAIAVSDLDGSRQAASLGKKGVVVPKGMRACLEGTSILTLQAVQEEMKTCVLKRYSWHEFSESEQSIFSRALEMFGYIVEAFKDNKPLCDELHISRSIACLEAFPLKISVVDFGTEDTRGLWESSTGECFVARKEMTNVFRFLRVALHEHAHAISGCSDLTVGHTYTEAEILIALAYALSIN